MTEDVLDQGPLRSGSPLRTPRAAAVAGIIFSLLMATALVLLRISVPARPGGTGVWLTDSGKRAAVAVAPTRSRTTPMNQRKAMPANGTANARTGSSPACSSAAACCSSP